MNNNNNTKKAGVERSHGRSLTEKTVFSIGHFGIILICIWLVFFNGLTMLDILFGQNWQLTDFKRSYILLACALLYWVRHFITLFYLLARKVEWSEVFGLLGFFALIEIGLLLTGGGAFREYSVKLNWLDIIAIILLIFGSYLNSFSEIQRKLWKNDPKNNGLCYTKGLFKYSMHINYFGDTVMFTGWCLFTNSLWSLVLPLMMAGMFIFYHIPGIDSYLSSRYGNDFKDYSKKTKKFIPFIY
jgi:protein-S-isoprenylcysteine O-methyltransferase Ste14